MRINRFIAGSTGMSRRAADAVIQASRVLVNGQAVGPGADVQSGDTVTLDGRQLRLATRQTILLHKPVGYVTSRTGQGSQTIYDLLPPQLHHLKPVGRLDKDSSGLLLLTNDGELAQQLTHPTHQKIKCYEVSLGKSLTPEHREHITKTGVQLEDGPSTFELHRLQKHDGLNWLVTMHEGRNRQIRRTFAALGYRVVTLHRTRFGDYRLGMLAPGDYRTLPG